MGLQAANLCALARLSREPRPCKSDRLRNRQSLLCEEQAPKPDGTEIKHCLLTFHPPNGADPFPKYKEASKEANVVSGTLSVIETPVPLPEQDAPGTWN